MSPTKAKPLLDLFCNNSNNNMCKDAFILHSHWFYMCFPINLAATTLVWIPFTTGHMKGGSLGEGTDSPTQPVSHLRHRALWYSKGVWLPSLQESLGNHWKNRLKTVSSSFILRHASYHVCTRLKENHHPPVLSSMASLCHVQCGHEGKGMWSFIVSRSWYLEPRGDRK